MTTIQHRLFLSRQHGLNRRIVIETITKMLVNALVHPILGLLVSTEIKIAVLLHKYKIFVYHVPNFLDTQSIETGISKDFRCPARIWSREKMQCIAEMSRSQFRLLDVATVSLIDHNAVCHFHDSTLDALQFITRTCQLNQQEEIDHRVYRCFTLTYPYSFYKYLIKTCSFTKNNGLTGLTSHPSQRTSRRARTDKCFGMNGKFFHTGLVPQDTPLGTLTTRVNGQYSQLTTFFQHMQTKHIDRRTLSGTRHPTDTDTHRVSRIRQALFDDFLGNGLMFGFEAFHHSDCLTQYRHISLDNAVYKLVHRIFLAFRFLTQLQIRVDSRRLFDACIYSQAFVFFAVFGMFYHSILSFSRLHSLSR